MDPAKENSTSTKPKIVIKGLPRPIVETHEEFGKTYEPVDSPITTNSFTFEGQMAAQRTAMVGAKHHINDKRPIVRWGSRFVMLFIVLPLALWLIAAVVGIVLQLF